MATYRIDITRTDGDSRTATYRTEGHSPQDALQKVSKALDTGDPYICRYCEDVTPTSREFRDHVDRNHPDIIRYETWQS